MGRIGEKLRQERLRQRLDLAQIANETRIDRRFLEAIEAEEWGRLPGRFFVNSFVRQYAGALGVDAGDIDSELTRLSEVEGAQSRSKPENPGPLADLPLVRVPRPSPLSLRRGRLAGAVLVGCALLLWGGFLAVRKGFWQGPPPVTDGPAAASAVETGPPVSPEKEGQGEGVTPAPGDGRQQPPEPISPPRPTGRLRVGLTAREAAWISLTVDGTVVFRDILSAGQTKNFEGDEKMSLWIGNAGGLEVHWNGKPIGPLGPEGAVRVVELTPEGFQTRRPGN